MKNLQRQGFRVRIGSFLEGILLAMARRIRQWARLQDPSELPTREPRDAQKAEEWLPVWYQMAHTDIQVAKERSWSVLRWSVTWLLGIFAADASGQFPTNIDSLFPWISLALASLVSLHLLDLHRWAARSRDRTDEIDTDWPDDIAEMYRLKPHEFDPDHWKYLSAKWGILAGIVSFIFLTH